MVLSPNIFKFRLVLGLPYAFGGHLRHPGAVFMMLAIGRYTSLVFNGLWCIPSKFAISGFRLNSIF